MAFMDSAKLQGVVAELVNRPGHEKVRALLHSLLTDGLGARSQEITFEEQLPIVKGRLDALWGYTVFEIKSDLRREQQEAESKLKDYISEKTRQTSTRNIGIVTDGAQFQVFELISGELRRQSTHTPDPNYARKTLEWLDSVVSISPEIPPTPELVHVQLGKPSLAWLIAKNHLQELWDTLKSNPECALKRHLWADHLARVYGSSVDADELFFQHTYLSIVAKTIAIHVLGLEMPSPQELLDGQPFEQTGILGAVEADFFDWPLKDPLGATLVNQIARQTERFRFRDVQVDVLKGLYESLIDPEQRHELGEYYTPDWLAHKICKHTIDTPLHQRVLDPSCGSGTFLFHAIRLFLDAAEEAGIPNRNAIAECALKVLGIDIHPLAVQIARVTYLLAIGQERLKDRPTFSIPVYLGDSLQWNTVALVSEIEVAIQVPGERTELNFPGAIASNPSLLDLTVGQMLDMSERGASSATFSAWIKTKTELLESEINVLSHTFSELSRLQREGKNHIWGFVVRNLVRPVWLSQGAERPDIIVGNPPWLSYRYMSPEVQARFKRECAARHIWAGGKVATHQDLSAYFLVRCVELYFKESTRLAFVMPHAVLNRQQYEGFRKGYYSTATMRPGASHAFVAVAFDEVWAFPNLLPLFPVPSCVLFCSLRAPFGGKAQRTDTVCEVSGILRRRDATPEEAESALTWLKRPWPTGDSAEGGSRYREDFKNGATVFPRLLATVEVVAAGFLGRNIDAPLVQSRRSPQEKQPWKGLPALKGNVEREFLRELYLGESIAPYRLLTPVLSVIPWDDRDQKLLSGKTADSRGYTELAKWMLKAEQTWLSNRSAQTKISFVEQLDYYGKLSAQFPISKLRIVFAASGTVPTAALLESENAVVEHALYWMPLQSHAEGHYLCAIFNSSTVQSLVEDRQARGQWGPRHFDKIIFSLPIPKFDPKSELHQHLAELAQKAAIDAASVSLPENINFIAARKRIREALIKSGVSMEIDTAVAKLLGAG